ncbi:MAG: DNA mismatch repair protein MutS, partial [Rhizobiaceae bacterium]
LDSVSFFLDAPQIAAETRQALKAVPDLARALSRLVTERGGPRDLGALRDGLLAASAMAARLGALDLPEEMAAAVKDLAAMPKDFGERLAASLADDLPLLKRDGGFAAAGLDAELDRLRALRDHSRRVIIQMQDGLIEETGIRSLKIRHNNILGYHIEVTANHQDILAGTPEAKARFIHRQTMASAMRFTTTELAELETKIANAASEALAIELALFDSLSKEAGLNAEAFRAGAAALAAIDVAAGFSELAASRNFVRPHVDGSLDFIIEGGRHPVVEDALRRQAGQPFVANDCDLSPSGSPYGAIWLLTGPNMGGKSTFLRQNALIAILAQTGAFVPARSARIGVVDQLFSRVGASDDLARGRSTFMVEMVETAAILNQAGERALVILDEIGRGTATFDGLSIAWASVEHLHETNRCRAIFATHFHEMTALSTSLSRLSNVTMKVKEWDGDVVFLHEVAHGAADRSYGVQVARLAGLPASVIDRARDVLAKLEDQGAAGRHSTLLDDLPLFSAPVAKAANRKPEKLDLAAAALKAINPDELTPREALEALYRLKGLQ